MPPMNGRTPAPPRLRLTAHGSRLPAPGSSSAAWPPSLAGRRPLRSHRLAWFAPLRPCCRIRPRPRRPAIAKRLGMTASIALAERQSGGGVTTTIGEAGTRPAGARLFGHPRGLFVLAGSELWERISFHGMQSLLTLYMVGQLFLPGHVEKIV